MPTITSQQPRGVHLVGSLPNDRFPTVADVFSVVPKVLSRRLKRIPNGELGNRNLYITWQEAVFPNHILKRTVVQNGGTLPESSDTLELRDLKPVMYDDAAIASYRSFVEARAAGTIPADVRFQVSLPSPIEPLAAFVHESFQKAAAPLYEKQLMLALERIQREIPPKDLAIQWDVAVTVALIESKRGRLDNPLFTCCFDDPLRYNIKALGRMAAAVKPEVDMGFHLCYGDINHQHFVEPEDISVMVEISKGLLRQIYMPVPKKRTDQGYFTPLTMLQLPPDTELFLSVLHPDGLKNTIERIKSAQNAAPKEFRVATECSLGRTKGREGDILLNIAVQVSNPYISCKLK
ncbi:hypothetical protein QBC46DRAFT_429789 [Diplogelasinospora grovesii]|uniref:Uncharacterized protein n=1 Tax=Diplogelasinospora grovesii TaxID=303347 RepID=A0AAN6MVS5_9PEZI|nr:hypothetical protein QBC46DRAFT_429789 [Diplogelasinospora grovesii]